MQGDLRALRIGGICRGHVALRPRRSSPLTALLNSTSAVAHEFDDPAAMLGDLGSRTDFRRPFRGGQRSGLIRFP